MATAENGVVQFTTKEENSVEYFKSLSEALLEIKSEIRFDNDAKAAIEVLLLRFSRNN